MCVSINGPGDPDLRPFDFETGVQVTSKAGNLPSEFELASLSVRGGGGNAVVMRKS